MPRTGVPPGVLVRGGVHLDDVLLAEAEVLADRHGEVGVAVRAVARERAVHPHRCTAVHALELEQHPLAAQSLVGDERLLVLPDAAGEEAVAPVLVRGRAVRRSWRRGGASPASHGCAPPPRSSWKWLTFGRTRQSSLKEVRFTMSLLFRDGCGDAARRRRRVRKSSRRRRRVGRPSCSGAHAWLTSATSLPVRTAAAWTHAPRATYSASTGTSTGRCARSAISCG